MDQPQAAAVLVDVPDGLAGEALHHHLPEGGKLCPAAFRMEPLQRDAALIPVGVATEIETLGVNGCADLVFPPAVAQTRFAVGEPGAEIRFIESNTFF